MRMIKLLPALLLSCCVVGEYRKQAVEYSLARVAEARDGIVTAAEASRELVEEVVSAVAESRLPQVDMPARKLSESLALAHASTEEAGKTLAIVQEDLGRPQTPAPIDPADAERMRIQYRAASRLFKMAVSWARSQLPFPTGPGGSGPIAGGGWTPTEIAGLLTALTAAAAALTEGTRRGVKAVKRRDAEIAEAYAQTDEALAALDELKRVHPDEVKAVTDRKKRPHLRHAYVRWEESCTMAGEGKAS